MNRRSFLKGALALTAYLVVPSLAKNDEANRKTDVELFQEALDTGIIEGYKFYFNHPITIFGIDDLIINECEFVFDMDEDERFAIQFKECNKITMTNCIIHNPNFTLKSGITISPNSQNYIPSKSILKTIEDLKNKGNII